MSNFIRGLAIVTLMVMTASLKGQTHGEVGLGYGQSNIDGFASGDAIAFPVSLTHQTSEHAGIGGSFNSLVTNNEGGCFAFPGGGVSCTEVTTLNYYLTLEPFLMPVKGLRLYPKVGFGFTLFDYANSHGRGKDSDGIGVLGAGAAYAYKSFAVAFEFVQLDSDRSAGTLSLRYRFD